MRWAVVMEIHSLSIRQGSLTIHGPNVDHAIGGVSPVLEAIVAFSFQHRPPGSRCCESWFQSIAESQCGTSSRSIPRSSGHTSETYQMVNKLERVPSPKFSIRDF